MPLVRIFLVSAWFAVLVAGRDQLEIQTSSGTVRGLEVPSIDGRTVDAFLGIPYGAPTGGQNRFSPPKEVTPWEGVLDVTEFSKSCFQVYPEKLKNQWWVSQNKESEDCLKLNIWVPKPRAKSRAVMVWIHGGALLAGSTDIPLYNGAALATQEEIIVVSLNYRLSVFGFLYLAHPQAPGNVGLMDQTLGLKWVQQNIEKFGGDPGRVTLFGESYGGTSVNFHLLAPTSLDLFQNAIVQSGSINGAWDIQQPKYALAFGLMLAEKAGCPVEENRREETVSCLQGLSEEEIVEMSLAIGVEELQWPCMPVVDGTYISESPVQLLEKGKFCTDKNVMFGFTREDGSFFFSAIVPELIRQDKSAYREDELKHILPLFLYSKEPIPSSHVELISHTYSEWNPTSSNYTLTLDGLLHLLTDYWFACPILDTADEMAEEGSSVFFYRFDYGDTERDFSEPLPPWLGASHGDELYFIFGRKLTSESKTEEVRLSKQIMRYWSNFAKTGDPNDDLLPPWPKYTNQNKKWMKLDSNSMTVSMIERQKECAFWKNVFPKLEFSSSK